MSSSMGGHGGKQHTDAAPTRQEDFYLEDMLELFESEAVTRALRNRGAVTDETHPADGTNRENIRRLLKAFKWNEHPYHSTAMDVLRSFDEEDIRQVSLKLAIWNPRNWEDEDLRTADKRRMLFSLEYILKDDVAAQKKRSTITLASLGIGIVAAYFSLGVLAMLLPFAKGSGLLAVLANGVVFIGVLVGVIYLVHACAEWLQDAGR